MTLTAHVHSRLVSLGIDCAIVEDEVHVRNDPRPIKIKFDEEWHDAYRHYRGARSINFDLDTRTLIHNNSVEVLLKRFAAPGTLTPDQYNLSDSVGNTVAIGTSTSAFALSFFDSDEYARFFDLRIRRRFTNSNIAIRRMPQILWMPTTAVYTERGRRVPADLKEKAIASINRSLFKIAVEQHESLSVFKPEVRRIKTTYIDEPSTDQSIPRSTYDEDVVSYYKVAKASPFPSQSFLAYYHVLEYYFLRISEGLLHDRLTAMLNDTSFHVDQNSLDKVISAVRGQDARSDETEMLRNVISRFVQEAELIDFILRIETTFGEKIYSKKRKIFGEDIQVAPMKDLALAHAAKTLKHIRNAIVHSTDRYKREDCHIPLSASENLIEEFIPLVRFFAEKVIYGTAT